MNARHEGVRFDPAAPRSHVESYFLKANDPKARRALWIKATILAPERDPSAAVAEAWAIAFREGAPNVAVKAQIPFATASFSKTSLDVTLGSLLSLTRDRSEGKIETGDRAIAWNLRLGGREEALVHYPAAWMYEGRFPSQKMVSPRLDARVSGTFDVDGERWNVDEWPGVLGHNWGRAHTPLYAWAHCNAWDGEDDVVFEAVSGKPAIGPFPSPTMLSSFYVRHRGVRYDLASPRTLLFARSDLDWRSDPKTWRFEATNDLATIEGELSCPNEDFVGLWYANPSGPMTSCLNSKLASCRLSLALSGKPAFTVVSSRAAFEIGTLAEDHGVRMYV
ncbi:MAG TPA: tocopherol cyclase family protein [Polyangiaceae bacterium]